MLDEELRKHVLKVLKPLRQHLSDEIFDELVMKYIEPLESPCKCGSGELPNIVAMDIRITL